MVISYAMSICMSTIKLFLTFSHYLRPTSSCGVLFSHRQRPQVMPTMQRSRRPEKRPVAFGTGGFQQIRTDNSAPMTDPWCCHIWCAMDPIYPSHVSMYTSTSRIRHGALGGCFCFFLRSDYGDWISYPYHSDEGWIPWILLLENIMFMDISNNKPTNYFPKNRN